MRNQITWEDVEIGTELPILEKNPNTRQLVQWAGASGDFYEIHYDKDFAIKNKLPGQIIHGALKGAWLGQLLHDWVGDKGRIIKYTTSYRGMDVPGISIYGKGKVVKKYMKDKEGHVECEIWLENAKGEKSTTGTGHVILPLRLGIQESK